VETINTDKLEANVELRMSHQNIPFFSSRGGELEFPGFIAYAVIHR
jgi:hypothetical protein